MKKILFILFCFSLLFADDIDDAINGEDYVTAEALLTNKVYHYPEDSDLRLRLAYAQLWQKKYKDAEFNFKKVMDNTPNYEDAYNGLANCYKWQNRTDDELFVLLDAYLRFKNKKTAMRLSEIFEEKGDLKKARFYAKKGRSKDSRNNLIATNSTQSTIFKSRESNLLKRWEYFAFYQYDFIKREGFSDWQYFNSKITHNTFKNYDLGVSYEHFKRFDRTQNNIGLYLKAKSRLVDATIDYYYGINPTFKEENRIAIDSWWKFFSKFIITMGYKYSAYPQKSAEVRIISDTGYLHVDVMFPKSLVHTIVPGFEYYYQKIVAGYKASILINNYKEDAASSVVFFMYNWNRSQDTYLSYSFGYEIYDEYQATASGANVFFFKTQDRMYSSHIGIKHSVKISSDLKVQFYTGFYDDEFDAKRTELGIGLFYRF